MIMNDEKIFQVSEFNEFVNVYLNQIGQVALEGEISNININQGKWIFITIKDKVSSVDIFGMTYKISGYDLLEVGMLVHIYGSPRLYSKTGRFSVFADRIIPAGEGSLRIAFEKLKLKLQNEGLFARKRPLPLFPEKIGLITAKDSRAYSDFIKVLRERMGGLKIYFYPVNVQGQDSVGSIFGAFAYFNKQPNLDLLILTRGGGSLGDLQSFNDERVARAIFSSKIPVVVGVGHEDDVTIADFVSDVRASTPSNAAELIVRNRVEVLKEIRYKTNTIEQSLKQLLEVKKQLVLNCVTSLKNAINNEIVNVRKLVNRFTTSYAIFSKEVTTFRQNTISLENQLLKVEDYWLNQKKSKLFSLIRLLESLDFHRVLERGFSITTDTNGKILKTYDSLQQGQSIQTTLFHGKIQSRITKKYE
jgi:exodeoxyribonuclease VII large subunit